MLDMGYPTSVNTDGFVDERACERLGLGAQWKQAIIDDRDDGMLTVLSGAGEMLIRPAGKAPCVLNFKETAALITFMNGDNAKRLFPAILRASLLARGGAAAELVEWMDAAFKKEESAAPPVDDDEPVCTVVDTGERNGVRLERLDRPSGESGWLDFRVGHDGDSERVLVSTYLYGSMRPGIELIIRSNPINERLEDEWTLADLQQLRDDLDRLLKDERLIGALSEQHAP